MRHLERRLQRLEASLVAPDGPTLEERLREALRDAHERLRLGLPAPALPQGEGPIWERWRDARARAGAARARLHGGQP